MPKLAAFPKGFLDALCVDRTMTVFEWIAMASRLEGVQGLEFYPGFILSHEKQYLDDIKQCLTDHGLTMPMFCYSPNFTHPNPAERRKEIDKYRQILDVVAHLGGESCRVLSGQAYPEVSRQDGVAWTVECIQTVLEDAKARNLVLVMENHYKDNYWEYPEFAQKSDVFWEIVSQIDSPHFGVNYDPSNAIIAQEDPLDVLRLVKDRVVSMHASDRYLKPGYTWDDIKVQDGSQGYAAALSHGVIGEGLNDYDAIFSILRSVGFDGWISIEDGENGIEEMERSAAFLNRKIAEHFGPGARKGS